MMRRALRAIKQPGAAHFFLQCEENDKKGGIAVNKKQLMIELAMPIVFMLMAVYIIVTAIPMESEGVCQPVCCCSVRYTYLLRF